MGSVRVSQLGKAYKQYGNHWSRLGEWLLPIIGPRHRLKWVLQDTNFEIAAGAASKAAGLFHLRIT